VREIDGINPAELLEQKLLHLRLRQLTGVRPFAQFIRQTVRFSTVPLEFDCDFEVDFWWALEDSRPPCSPNQPRDPARGCA
jgi:hypothetical protein